MMGASMLPGRVGFRGVPLTSTPSHRPLGLVAVRNRRPAVTLAAAQPEPEVAWYDRHRSSASYRSVYDFKAWVQHRDPNRYIQRFFFITQSAVSRNVLPAVLWVIGVATGIGVYMHMLTTGILPAWMPPVAPNAFAQAFVTNTTMVMSLLLVFRTTQSYNRWDESRKFWGATLNRCRDNIRQAVTLFPDEVAKTAYARWIVAFVRAMHRHFQNEGNLEADLKHILPRKELDMLLRSQHRPMKALHVMGQLIMTQPIPPIHQMQMSANISHFHDQLGACERLLRTPIPVSYTRHTSRFLFFWLTMLPFAMWSAVGWGTIPCCALIALSLLKIDEIGMQIEEPFSILPLAVICARIQTDVESTLADDREVKEVVMSNMVLPEMAAKVVPEVAYG